MFVVFCFDLYDNCFGIFLKLLGMVVLSFDFKLWEKVFFGIVGELLKEVFF